MSISQVPDRATVAQIIKVVYTHAYERLRKINLTFRLIGHDVTRSTVSNILTNESCGHAAGILFRQKWQVKKWGKLSDWHLTSVVLEEEALPEGANLKPTVALAVQETIDTPTLSDIATGLWRNDRQYLLTACGEATLHALPETPAVNRTVVVQWSFTGPQSKFPVTAGSEQDETAAKLMLVRQALKGNWPEGELGSLDLYRVARFTYDHARLFLGSPKKHECPIPKN